MAKVRHIEDASGKIYFSSAEDGCLIDLGDGDITSSLENLLFQELGLDKGAIPEGLKVILE